MIMHHVNSNHRRTAASVAVAGGGFSGAAVAYHLAKRWHGLLDITIFEPREALGRGVAYSAPGEHLLLNVPAGKLSIDPDAPGDFLRWNQSMGHDVAAEDFLPRAWFGSYVEDRLVESVGNGSGRVVLRRVVSSLERIDCDDATLSLSARDGTRVEADHLALALGNGPTRVPGAIRAHAASDRVLLSPWDAPAMAKIAANSERVLLVGTGLTMCDAALSLARLGFSGELIAISRRGQLPRVHGDSNPSALLQWRDALAGDSLRELVREVRHAAGEHGWRSAIDALRPRTAELWAGLSLRDRKQFVARVAPYWDSARHRQPQAVAEAIQTRLNSGLLRIVRGGLRGVHDDGHALSCEVSPPGTVQSELVRADAVVLCTGPEPDPARWGSPLLGQLLTEGVAQRDPLGYGLRTTGEGFLIRKDDAVEHRLSTIGSLRRGSLWESTAVPELSAQASNLAHAIESHIQNHSQSPTGSRLTVQEMN